MPKAADRVKDKTFTGTGVMDSIGGRAVDVSISGSFTASIQIQRQLFDGTWVAIETLTAPGQRVIESAVGRQVRCECTAFTSGAARCVLEAGS